MPDEKMKERKEEVKCFPREVLLVVEGKRRGRKTSSSTLFSSLSQASHQPRLTRKSSLSHLLLPFLLSVLGRPRKTSPRALSFPFHLPRPPLRQPPSIHSLLLPPFSLPLPLPPFQAPFSHYHDLLHNLRNLDSSILPPFDTLHLLKVARSFPLSLDSSHP